MSIGPDAETTMKIGEPALLSRADPSASQFRRQVLAGFAVYLTAAAAAWWAILNLAPDHITVKAFGHAYAASDIRHRLLTRGLELAVIIPGVFIIDLALAGWRDSSLYRLLVLRTPSTMSDLAAFLLWRSRIWNTMILILSLGISLLSGAYLHNWIKQHAGVSLSLAWMSIPAQCVAFFAIYSFLDYWTHRVDHSRHFWPLHRFHHAAEDFCVFTAVRVHPAVFTSVIITTIPAGLLQVSPAALIDVNLFVMALRFVIHSRINSNFGWVGRYLLQSPVHHRLHHILDMTQPVGHFSLVPLWDRMFGTWRGEADQSLVIGVDTPYQHGAWLAPDLFRDYFDFWKGLWPFRSRPAAVLEHFQAKWIPVRVKKMR
ncbi:MAG: sterol desaturase family protein [Caulobacteraceae bacterium]|nr:sterol desaturase family protein [Caulobacteraceae bacterium]